MIALAIHAAAFGQAPVISNIVNAASYQPTQGASGSIASIMGANLAATTATAGAVPLPFELGGTTVTVEGHAVPLFYVSPTQINFQVPQPGTLAVVVTTAAGSSLPYEPPEGSWLAAGIFTMNASGCGLGALFNVAADGGLSLNSAANGASPGDWISVFGTGVTGVYTDGAAAPISPLIAASTSAGFEFDFQAANTVTAAWAGFAPGYVGLDQYNVQIPTSIREGCSVPLQVSYGGLSEAISQPVTLAISQGGACADPPSAGYGQVTWQKTVTTTGTNTTSETDTMTMILLAAPGSEAPALVYTGSCPPPSGVCAIQGPGSTSPLVFSDLRFLGPACPVSGYSSLAAGTVTMQGPGLSLAQVPSLPYQQGQLGGLSAYQAALPSGAIQAGTFTVTAAGGADVGAFQAPLQIGADIQLQTALEEANIFEGCTPLTVNWTGGDPNSWVTLSFLYQTASSGGGYQGNNVGVFQTRTSSGSIVIPPLDVLDLQCAAGTTPIEVIVEVDPDPSEIGTFSAIGLALGGQATLSYVHAFQATLWTPG
jgi:uncharacterized protein (TIGR03437 family)